MKKILVINGHPVKKSFNAVLAESYRVNALKSGAEVKVIHISDLHFGSPFLESFTSENQSDDLKKSQELIAWADHSVWIYPTWWYLPPAQLKAFIEHVFLPGFAFKYKENPYRVDWDKYLTGKTAHIISTMDAPPLFYKLIVGNPGGKAMKSILDFCGIKLEKQTYFGSVKTSKESIRKKWIKKVEKLGKQMI